MYRLSALPNLRCTACANCFGALSTYELSANSRRLRDYYALPLQHQAMLDSLGWRTKIDLVDQRIEANARFLKTIVDYPEIFEGDSDQQEHEHDDEDADDDSDNVEREDTIGTC
jgi:carnosine N-methyltransferase